MHAGTVTFTAGSDKTQGLTITKGGITITMTAGSFSQKIYSCSGMMTISSEVGNITEAVITCMYPDTQGPNNFYVNQPTGSYSYSGTIGTWTGDAESFTLNAGLGVSMTSIVITYTDPSPSYTILATSSNDSYGTVSVESSTITASPSSGYRVVSGDGGYTVTTGTATVVNNGDNTFSVSPSSDCSIQINFEVIPIHTVTWSVLGETASQEYAEGAAIVFPDNPSDRGGKVFRGWTTAAIDGEQADAPALTTSATMSTSDLTYYAVFATENIGEEEITKTYGFETESDADWTIDGPVRTQSYAKSGSYAGMINTSQAYVTFNQKVSVLSFSFDFIRTSTNNTGFICVETSTDNTKWTTVNTYEMNTFPNGSYRSESVRTQGFDGTKQLYVRFYCSNSNGVTRYVDDITITYKGCGTTYSDYCTTMTPSPATTTLTIAEACTNGNGTYYSTYSNASYAFVVPEELTVSEISVDNNDCLTYTPYATGDIVPLNTGVLISATSPGEKTLSLSYATGSAKTNDNMLRGTGATGVTAEEMAEADADCNYYRLTMHNGSQLGFWWGAEEGAAFAVAVNKAYLAIPIATSVRMGFSFDEESGTTSIGSDFLSGIRASQFPLASESSNESAATYYTLDGQRVEKPTKGLFIMKTVSGDKVQSRKVIIR